MLAMPESANSILRTALVLAARRLVPDKGALLEEFVRGPLRRATDAELGPDAADALMDDLAILVRTAFAVPVDVEDTHVRLTKRPEDDRGYPAILGTPVPTMAPPSDDGSAIRVVFAGRCDGRFGEMIDVLGADADVHRVSDVFELVDAVSMPSEIPVVVVIDRESSVMRTSTLAAASEELPAHAHVVLWGDSNPATDEMPDMLRAPENWTELGDGTSVRELAVVLRRVGAGRGATPD